MIIGSRSETTAMDLQLSPSRARVCVLVRDTDGNSPVFCKTFSHVESAEAFIQGRLERGAKQGFLVFWTLLAEPSTDGDAKVVVLIPEKKADSVLQFSFPDLKAARTFVQRKFAGRDAIITWSTPIELHRDERGIVSLSPSTPPHTSASALSATFETDVQEALSFADEPDPSGLSQDAVATPLVSEVRRVLAVKRWEFIPGSFAGFHSPPGRF